MMRGADARRGQEFDQVGPPLAANPVSGLPGRRLAKDLARSPERAARLFFLLARADQRRESFDRVPLNQISSHPNLPACKYTAKSLPKYIEMFRKRYSNQTKHCKGWGAGYVG